MKSQLKPQVVQGSSRSTTMTQKSVGQKLLENIPDGMFKGLSKILESHEIPKQK